MKSRTFLLFFILSFLSLSTISASWIEYIEYDYLQVAGGADFVQDKIKSHVDIDYDVGYAIRGSIGMKWCWGIRTELEIGYRSSPIKDVSIEGVSAHLTGHLSHITGFLNIFYDFPSCWDITPFLGAGVGYQYETAELKGHNLKHIENNDHAVTGQFIAGISYPISPCWLLSLDYRYLPFDEDARSQVLGLGISYLY